MGSWSPWGHIPWITLSDGVRIPSIGYGTCGAKLEITGSKDYAKTAAKWAMDIGYRFLDTAALYKNERSIGRAIKDELQLGVSREELFICSKLWNTSHKRASVMNACMETLNRLQLKYLDLYLIHWPMAYLEEEDYYRRVGSPEESRPFNEFEYRKDPDNYDVQEEFLANPRNPRTGRTIYTNTHFTETWRGMEDVLEAGLVRSIGLSNFNHEQIEQILTMPGLRHKPSVLQVEMHPYLSQRRLWDYCRYNSIQIIAYSPLGSPGSNWPTNKLKPKVLQDPVIERIADWRDKTPAQIILRYHIQRGVIPIPKSSSVIRMRENMALFDFNLSESEMDKLMELGDEQQVRYCELVADHYAGDHPHYPFLGPPF